MPEQPDALLLLSFGGPEGPGDVMPFLRRVTRGRNVPEERLAAVAEHYLHFDGVSPINALNREIIANIERELVAQGWGLPVYFGNRNWHPLIEDTAAQMATDGVRHALVFATSAWAGYSGCRQYHEDIVRARASVGASAPTLTKLPQFFDHPLFIGLFADQVREAFDQLPPEEREGARLVFTAHSIPDAADLSSGPRGLGGRLYSRQVHEASALIAAAAGATAHDVVWQSRSGPPSVPWLEPNVCDHLKALARQGVSAVVVCPVGFVSDHMEVVWDLDYEAKDLAESLGMTLVRASTPGADPRFAKMVVGLAREAAEGQAGQQMGMSENGAPCFLGCCGS